MPASAVSTSASAPSRLRWYIKAHPEIVILALGGNDGLRGLSVKHMKKNLSKAIELAQSEKILILLAGMQIPQNYGTEYTESFRNVFHELAKQYQLQMIPFLLKEVGGVSSLNQDDGIHPNPEGHQIIFRTVLEYLEPLFANQAIIRFLRSKTFSSTHAMKALSYFNLATVSQPFSCS